MINQQYIRGVPVKWYSLSFHDHSLELKFRESYYTHGLRQLQIITIVAAALFSSYAFFDVYIVGHGQIDSVVLSIWLTRLSVALILVAFTLLVAHLTPSQVSTYCLSIWMISLSAGWVIFILATPDRTTDRSVGYLYSFVLVSIGGTVFLPLLFSRAAIIQPLLFLPMAHQKVTSGAQNTMIVEDYFYPSMILSSAILMGLYAKNHSERVLRASFLQNLELEKANKIKSEFLSMVSHELRTPLNGVMGSAQLALLEARDGHDITRRLEQIDLSSHAMRNLIDDVLEISRLDIGSSSTSVVPFKLSDIIGDIRAVLEPQCESNGLYLNVVDISGTTSILNGDGPRLRHILLNLLGNAVKFTQEGGVSMTSRFDDDHLLIVISDTGIGIPKSAIPHIFDAFVRAENAGTTGYGGAGLGLSLVRRFVSEMNGTITVNSHIGMGSTFHLRLPMTRNDAFDVSDTERYVETQIPNIRSMRILVIEDDPASGEILASLLRRDGHIVDLATSGESAIERFDASTTDAVLTDIQLPGISGVALLEALRSRMQDFPVPVIAVTANSMPEELVAYKKAGFTSVLSKPVEHRVLQATLHDIIGAHFDGNLNSHAFAKRLKELVGEEDYERVIAAYSQTLIECSDGLEEALGRADLHKISYFAHRLKGSSESLGKPYVAKAAHAVETVIQSGKKPQVDEIHDLIEQCRNIATSLIDRY